MGGATHQKKMSTVATAVPASSAADSTSDWARMTTEWKIELSMRLTVVFCPPGRTRATDDVLEYVAYNCPRYEIDLAPHSTHEGEDH